MNLTDAVENLTRVELAPGAVVHASELEGAAFVLVADGLVVLRSSIPGSARRTITCHAGEGALVLPPEDDDSIAALTEAAIVPIAASDRDRLLESPAGARLLLDALAETLRQKQAAVASLSRLHHVDRVREKLLELAREHGRVGRDGIRLDFPLTHDLLGEMTGSARETVTRALDELQRQGFVQRRGRTYSVCVSPEELVLNGRARSALSA